ncbi:MAG TPA: Ig-like domain-containing protein [Longimicrobium sp.]|nr:Ig-like domain-containing protein [Longimicrobium sp.]
MNALIRALPALVLLVAACSDRMPLSGGVETDPQPRAVQRLECTARVAEGSLTCVNTTTGATGARGNLVLGGGYVQLASSNVRYESGPALLRADVTVKNLLRQAIGTTDGTTADSAGVKVFFHTGPTLTQGSGPVSVANHDGTAAFTAGAQPFFRYTGVLEPLQTSAAKEWVFNVGNDVQEFVFTVYVSATVASETGWVDVSPPHPYVQTGNTRQMAATVRNAAGATVTGAGVTWGSSDDAIATVDANGLVTAVSAGTVTITATSGARTGAQQLTVTAGEGDVTPPALTGFVFTPHEVDVSNNSAQVSVTFYAEDVGSGVQSASVVFKSPSQTQTATCNSAANNGTAESAVFQCTMPVNEASEAGTWKPSFIALRDLVNNVVSYTAPEMEAAGIWTDLRVHSDPDNDAPTLTGFSFTPDSVDITDASQQVQVTISASDAKSGLERVGAIFRSPSRAKTVNCGSVTLASGTAANGTFTCSVNFPRAVETGDWTVETVLLVDQADNMRQVGTEQLTEQGLPTVMRVRGTADTEAPVLTGFSFTPDSVDVRSSSQQITVTLTATDAGTGVYGPSSNIVFRSPVNDQRVNCSPQLVSGTTNDGTFQCVVTVPMNSEGGTWTAYFIVLRDLADNLRVINQPDIEAAGFPTELKVTSN